MGQEGRAPVGPNVFIELAEKTGFVYAISIFVIENTIKQIIKWETANISMICAINIRAPEAIAQELIE